MSIFGKYSAVVRNIICRLLARDLLRRGESGVFVKLWGGNCFKLFISFLGVREGSIIFLGRGRRLLLSKLIQLFRGAAVRFL